MPNLWIGELPSCLSPDYLEHANIHNVVTCHRNAPSPPYEVGDGKNGPRWITKDHVFLVPLDDADDAPAYIYFTQCNRFISNALQESWEADPEPFEDIQNDHYVEGLTLREGRPGLWSSQSKKGVLVHCQAGCSRSVTVR